MGLVVQLAQRLWPRRSLAFPQVGGLERRWGNSIETLKSREVQKMDVPKDCHIEECETEKQKYFTISFI